MKPTVLGRTAGNVGCKLTADAPAPEAVRSFTAWFDRWSAELAEAAAAVKAELIDPADRVIVNQSLDLARDAARRVALLRHRHRGSTS